MKTKFILASPILALALLTCAPSARAQSSSVPGSLSYQGRINDASGNLVGNPTPVNRTVIFRVWDSATAGNLLYSEQQVVTIASGEFNVLVGLGSPLGTEPKPAFDSVFNGAQRFLGVTVDDGTAAADPEITPRQQWVTSAFAFRAKTAEGVPNNAITSSMLAAGAVTPNSIAANAIDGSKLAAGAVTATRIAAGAVTSGSIAAGAIDSSKLAAGAVTTGSIAANAVDGSKLAAGAVTTASIADNAIVTSKLAAGSVTVDKLSLGAGTGFWNSAGADVYRDSGRVGIRTASPQTLLHLVSPFVAGGSPSQTDEVLRITGPSRNGSDPVHGASIVLANNTADFRAIAIADSQRIKNDLIPGNYNGPKLRMGIAFSSSTPSGNYGLIDVPSDNYNLDYGRLSLCPYGTGLNGGTVGIGTQNPSSNYKLHVAGGARFDGTVYASFYGSSSDARIKSIVARSSPGSDLELIRKLQVTDYRMIDERNFGDGVQKGFIAQEVREIVPEAVKKVQHSFIPSIYAPATAATFDPDTRTLRIVLEKAHGLEKGDTVQVKDKQRSWELNVSETIDATTFVAGPVEGPISEPFVYGKKVDDFLSVNYERLFTTGIGAIQELARQVNAVEAENAGLRNKLAASERRFAELEAADKVRRARLTAIEKALRTSGGAVVTAVAEKKNPAN